jgi:D-aminopeptidase
MPWIEGVVVKKATGRASCDCLPGDLARSRIERAAGHALQNLSQMQPFLVPPPITVEVYFPSPAHANQADSIPRAMRSSQTSLVYVADDFSEAYRFFTTALRLAFAVRAEATLEFLTSDEATAARLTGYQLQRSEDFWRTEPWIVVELPPK